MERIINSGTIRLAFDFILGVTLLVLLTLFLSANFDMVVTALSAFLVVVSTALFMRQDYQIIKGYKAERV